MGLFGFIMPACLYSNNIYALIKNWAKLKVEDLDLCADAKNNTRMEMGADAKTILMI